jgi:hypothetical protein
MLLHSVAIAANNLALFFVFESKKTGECKSSLYAQPAGWACGEASAMFAWRSWGGGEAAFHLSPPPAGGLLLSVLARVPVRVFL